MCQHRKRIRDSGFISSKSGILEDLRSYIFICVQILEILDTTLARLTTGSIMSWQDWRWIPWILDFRKRNFRWIQIILDRKQTSLDPVDPGSCTSNCHGILRTFTLVHCMSWILQILNIQVNFIYGFS